MSPPQRCTFIVADWAPLQRPERRVHPDEFGFERHPKLAPARSLIYMSLGAWQAPLSPPASFKEQRDELGKLPKIPCYGTRQSHIGGIRVTGR